MTRLPKLAFLFEPKLYPIVLTRWEGVELMNYSAFIYALDQTDIAITGTGTLDGLNIGKAWLLPPTLTLQYHFTEFGAFKPYVGAGVNYTFFFSQSAAGGTVIDSHLKDAFAPAVQVGFDYMFDKHWGWNVDVKKLWLRPSWNGVAGGAALTGKVNLDPWLIGTGITYKF